MQTLSMSLLFFFLLLLPFISAGSNLIVYQVFEEHGFPARLLLKGVLSYDQDTSIRKFFVYLNETCSYTMDSYNLKYKSTISGVISQDKLADISGIQVKGFKVEHSGFESPKPATGQKNHMDHRMQKLSMALLFFFFLLLLPFISAASNLTVYQVLEEYGFPAGLLPKGVLSYDLDTSTGKFSVYLNETCGYTIDSYNLKYKSTISGVISQDKLADLSGIQVKVFLFWLTISEVTRDGDELDLSVGIASADFPISNFEESPTCGCGFDCDGFNSCRNVTSGIPVTQSLSSF